MHDRSVPPQTENIRRACMLVASLTIGTVIWFLLGDSDSLVAEETPSKPPRAESVLAEVGGIPVTEAEVRSLVSDELESLEIERRRLLEAALEVRVRELMVEVAAAERGITPTELIALEVDQKLDQVAQTEVDAFMAAAGLADTRELDPLMVRRGIRMQSFIQELESRPDVERPSAAALAGTSSEDSVSEDGVSEDDVSEDGVSGDDVSED